MRGKCLGSSNLHNGGALGRKCSARPTDDLEQVENMPIASLNVPGTNEEWHENIFRYTQPF